MADRCTVMVTLRAKPVRWPNYLLVAAGDGHQVGFDVGELTPEQVDALCDDFRAHCEKRRKALEEDQADA